MTTISRNVKGYMLKPRKSWLIIFVLVWSSLVAGIVAHPLCIAQHPLTIIDLDQQQSKRMLQTGSLHNYRIYGHFPANSDTMIDIGLLSNIFLIASEYFKNTLKVTNIPDMLTRYPSMSGTCGVTVPDIFVNSGFDQTLIDLVVFIVIKNNPQQSYVAAAAPCIKIRRPVYGYIIFNAAFVETNIRNTGNYHSNVYVTMHEMTHILGLNNNFYSEFYISPFNNTKLRVSQVVQPPPNNPQRSMIITPNVKKYVQSYFGCADPRVGALLEDQGSSGSAGSHWERKVYLDQIMTASSFASGLKMSPLTLNLLLDTGFYQQVNLGLAQDLYFGRNQGCPFALGVSDAKPEFSCSTACDFYNIYGGQCSNKDSFANGAFYLRPLGNLICTFPQKTKTTSTIPGFNFSALSRCFDVVSGFSGLDPHCYLSKCNGNNIDISIDNRTYTCSPGSQSVAVPGGLIICPSDRQRFCSVRNCQNWCNAHGICIKGTCICAPPWRGMFCQEGCPNLFDFQTNECVDSCSSGKVIYSKGCINRCPPLFKIDGDGTNCVRCSQSEQCWEKTLSLQMILLVLLLSFYVL